MIKELARNHHWGMIMGEGSRFGPNMKGGGHCVQNPEIWAKSEEGWGVIFT